MIQQGDPKLYNTTDSGEIDIESGLMVMDSGVSTALYLSLFGGNCDDPGGSNEKKSWWGNIGNVDNEKYRSRTQNLIQSIPATSSNLLRIKDAVEYDISWLNKYNGIENVSVSVSIPKINTIEIIVSIIFNGNYYKYNFKEQWAI